MEGFYREIDAIDRVSHLDSPILGQFLLLCVIFLTTAAPLIYFFDY
jgi:hypothetical protein